MTQHELHQAAEALQHIRLTDIRHNSTDDAQRLAALRSKYSNAVFDVIPSGNQFAIRSDVFSFAIRHRLGLNLGIGNDYARPISDLTAESKNCDFRLHNALRDTLVTAIKLGGADFAVPEPNKIWIDPMSSTVVVPDIGARRDGKTYGIDVHAHSAISSNPNPLAARIAIADATKVNGKGTVESLRRTQATADAAEATAEAARAAGSRDAPALTEHARTARRACSTSYHGGYGIAASAAGDSFFPAGFTEFSGWGKSAQAMLKHIMHPGDSLARDEPGARFDGGTAATWATRSHRAFTVHSVAVAAARAVFRAVSRDSRRARRSAAPPSAKFPHKFYAHTPRNTARRAARMNDRVA